ncbi:GrpB family protein [Ornithinimicrobium sp. LYQ92]|uniref:GrpB family protein n=1 Tax=Serinicoccus sp. LYQ92 TaxID=3378798 RepID=UPI003854E5F9
MELVECRPVEWAQRFQGLVGEVRKLVGDEVRIEHIGSTAVPDLPSKDVVDVLVGVAPGHVASVGNRLLVGGFVLEGQREGHEWLTRRKSGRRVCVIHVVESDSRQWLRRIAFRDLLRRDADARAEYLQTKRAAQAETSGWNDYTHAKTATVHRLLRTRST